MCRSRLGCLGYKYVHRPLWKSLSRRSKQNTSTFPVPLPFYPRSRSNVYLRWVFQQAGLHRLDLQFAASYRHWISQISTSGRIAVVESGSYPLVIEYLGSSTDGASLLSGSTVFTSYRFCPVLWAWSSLARCGRITVILASIKITSADPTWIYRLAVQITLISFILLK